MRRKPDVNRVFLVFALAFGLVFPAYIFGHGVEVYDLSAEDRPVRTVYFKYSTGEPVSFAKIKIYPPSTRGKNVETLVSITDRNGIFCFIPDEAGEWRVDMEDGMGHKGTINVAAFAENAAPDIEAEKELGPGRPPLALKIVLGLSLLANIFGGWLIAASGRRKAAAESAGGGDAYK
jgi:nickel transport protein